VLLLFPQDLGRNRAVALPPYTPTFMPLLGLGRRARLLRQAVTVFRTAIMQLL
jgi:hypothetical protein